jgi:hypothetical protein
MKICLLIVVVLVQISVAVPSVLALNLRPTGVYGNYGGGNTNNQGGVNTNNQGRGARDGIDMNLHNRTGHEVLVYLFNDDHVHLNEQGGTQFAHLKNNESAIAHAPHCKYSILLVDKNDVWHAEFHDCHSADVTFTRDTGHAIKKH